MAKDTSSRSHRLILSLGGNLGDVRMTLATCRTLLAEQIGPIDQASRIYQSEPWGVADQPDYLNQILLLLTDKSPSEVLQTTREIENQLGRQRKVRWGPRVIDIDLLFYDDLELETEDLVLPHPRIHERNFILVPLMEIAPDWIHPGFQVSIEELYIRCQDFNDVMVAEEE